jgi:hypothetical protein
MHSDQPLNNELDVCRSNPFSYLPPHLQLHLDSPTRQLQNRIKELAGALPYLSQQLDLHNQMPDANSEKYQQQKSPNRGAKTRVEGLITQGHQPESTSGNQGALQG